MLLGHALVKILTVSFLTDMGIHLATLQNHLVAYSTCNLGNRKVVNFGFNLRKFYIGNLAKLFILTEWILNK